MEDLKYAIPLKVKGQVQPVDSEEEFNKLTKNLSDIKTASKDDAIDRLLDDLKTSASDDLVVNGRPKMMHVTAFIVHEGFNNNLDGFVGEELRTAVQNRQLFQAGHAGIIDVDHNMQVYGYWYDAEYTFDPDEEKNGILAHGAIWAYRFPEVSDRVLAHQHRDGFVRFSMTCLCPRDNVEYVALEDGEVGSVLHDPVFLGASVILDSDPGSNAEGVAEEDPVMLTKTERKQLLLERSAGANNNNDKLEDLDMDELIKELKPLLSDKLGDHSEQVVLKISNLIDDKLGTLNDTIEQKTADLEAAQETIQDLESEVENLRAELEEKGVAVDSLKEQKDELVESLAEAEGELADYREQEEKRAFEQKQAERLNEVSETIREKIEDKPDNVKDAILTRWAKMSDEEWEATKTEHSLVADAVSTSGGGKRLPGSGSGGQEDSIDRFLK